MNDLGLDMVIYHINYNYSSICAPDVEHAEEFRNAVIEGQYSFNDTTDVYQLLNDLYIFGGEINYHCCMNFLEKYLDQLSDFWKQLISEVKGWKN